MLSFWGAVAVAPTYSTVEGTWEFGFRHNPEEPLESLALHMIPHNLSNRNYLQRHTQINRYIQEWKADVLLTFIDIDKIRREDIKFIVGTGYGRYKVTFGNAQVTEIACHAKGANFLFPNTRTVIDIGGQDTKVIRVGEKGEVINFSMNDKCAAGTGRFLSAAADILNLTLDEIGPISLKSSQPVKLTSVCPVFVESEILSYIARAKK